MLRRIGRQVCFWIQSSFKLVVGKADCTNPRFAALIASTGSNPDCCFLVSCSFGALRQECQFWKHHPGYQWTENPRVWPAPTGGLCQPQPWIAIQKNENLFSKKQRHLCWWGQVTEQVLFVKLESVSPLDGNFHRVFPCLIQRGLWKSDLKWLQAGPAGCHCHLGCFFSGCATTVLVTGAGIGEMVLQLLVGSVSVSKGRRWGVPKPASSSLEILVQVLGNCWQKHWLTPELSKSKALTKCQLGIQMLRWHVCCFFFSLQLQIIHDQGSYSFLVCGMIFGGLAFTFYAFLLFFHRMYPKPSSGKKAPALSPAL